MWIYTVTWCLLSIIITTNPQGEGDVDQWGRVPDNELNETILVAERLVWCDNEVRFLNRPEAIRFYQDGVKEINKTIDFIPLGKTLYSIKIDSILFNPLIN